MTWFLAFYKLVGSHDQAYVEVCQNLLEPKADLQQVANTRDRGEVDGYMVGDVVRAERRPTGYTVEGEITVIQPDGRYSVEGPDGYHTYDDDEIKEVLKESRAGKVVLKGVAMFGSPDAAETIRDTLCNLADVDPSEPPWWDFSIWEARKQLESLDLWISYEPTLYTLKEFQDVLSGT